VAASGCLLVVLGLGLADYPLACLALAVCVAAYAALLWRWPGAFLVVLPILLPALDLGLWTGWMMLGESDLFILATLAVCLIRAPPVLADLRLNGAAGVALLALTTLWVVATVTGLASPLGLGPSDNAFLRPDNALRLGKGLAEALVLLPFINQRQRVRGDAAALLAWGMAGGLLAVTAAVLVEKSLFFGVADFSGAYRVAGPFSSMRVGGGHIGAYTALALPFTLALGLERRRWLAMLARVVALLAGSYTLAATLARTGYAAGMAGVGVTVLSRIGGRGRGLAGSLLPVAIFAAIILGVGGFTGMRARFAESSTDFATREGNWRAGLAVRDQGVLPTLFGMGLGTYQRAMLERSPVNRPSDLVLLGGGGVELRIHSPFYLGQKIIPDGGMMHVALSARAIDGPGDISVIFCDKVLLYSDQCRGAGGKAPLNAGWRHFAWDVPSAGLGETALSGLVRRPVEFSVFTAAGVLDVRDIEVTDDRGRSLLANADFRHGLDRWIFTDDSHVSWRMLNVYLMLFFETGVVGVLAYLALAAVAIGHAIKAGGVVGGALTGSVVSFLVSGLFDDVLEAPRIATLFFLVCVCALTQRPVGLTRGDR
jgi:hypothetical protein